MSNLIGSLKDTIGLRGELSESEANLELARGIAYFISGLRSLVPGYLSLKFLRLYCYGSHTEVERRVFQELREWLKKIIECELYIVERSGSREREKYVDVKLATDLLYHAIMNVYDIAMLVSGDKDFVPVIQRVKDLGKKVYVLFFPRGVAEELIEAADRYLPITPLRCSSNELEVATMWLRGAIRQFFIETVLNKIYEQVTSVLSKEYIKPLIESSEYTKNFVRELQGTFNDFLREPHDMATRKDRLESFRKKLCTSLFVL